MEDGVQDVPPEVMDTPHVKIVKQEVFLYRVSDNAKLLLVLIQQNRVEDLRFSHILRIDVFWDR